jgi:GNAT superfamily N-acetyltransferase
MIEVDKIDRYKLQPLFEGLHDTIILTCIQGHMGRAWADQTDNPKAALLQVGDFCFIGGDAKSEQAVDIITQMLQITGLNVAYCVVENKPLGELMEKLYLEDCKKIQRYAIKKRQEEFDLEKLQAIVGALPEKYTLCPIDGKWYEEALQESWSSDLVSSFSSKEDYIERGIGRVIIHNGKIVSGASSYSIYNGGIEIEIDTHEDYRRQGLALITGAALILACRQQGLYPNWDAANMMSVQLAEKLGYEFSNPYDTFMVRKKPIC